VSAQKPKSRARSTRAGRTLALRVLYAADLSQETPMEVWQRSSPELLFAEHLPLPESVYAIEADRDAEPVVVQEDGQEADPQEEEAEETPVLEGWDAVLAASQEEETAQGRRKEDITTVAARLALDWIARIQSRMDEIDTALQGSSPRWKVKRMMPMDRNILRIGVFELLEGIIPPRDVIYDCVELGKAYGDKNTARFVNGVLDQFCRDNKIRL
jgi:N utilization substance protein B